MRPDTEGCLPVIITLILFWVLVFLIAGLM